MKAFIKAIEKHLPLFLVTLLTGLAFSLACVVSPSLSGQLIDAFARGAENAGLFLAAFLGASAAQVLLSQADMFLFETLKLRLKQLLRANSFQGFCRTGGLGQGESAKFLSFVNNDVPTLAEQYYAGVIDIAKCLGLLLFSAASLLQIHWMLALVIVGVSLLTALLPRLMGSRDSQAREAYSRQLGSYNALLRSFLGGVHLVRAYLAQAWSFRLLEKENAAAAQAEALLVRRRLLVYALTGLLEITKTVLLVVLGVWLMGRGDLAAGGLIAALQLAALIGAPMEVLAYLFQARSQALPLLKQYRQLTGSLPVSRLSSGQAPAAIPFHQLAVQGVTCSVDGVDILRDLSAQFLAGEKYLITGESGSGKSTLLGLLSRLGDKAFTGQVLYNQASLESISPEAYYAQVCPVFQEPCLFYTSLEENILLGRNIDPAFIRRWLAS